MVTCGRCGDEATDAIQCSACLKHFDFPCSGVTEKGYRKLGDRQATWRCGNCKNTGLPSAQSLSNAASPVVSPTVTLETIMRELTSIRLKLAPLSSLTSEVQLIRKELADLKELPAKVQSIDERLVKVEGAQEDVALLKTTILNLEGELQDTQQWLRGNNVEIKGVPLKDKENLFDIISKIGEKVLYPVTKTQINFIHRVPTNANGVKNIIVSFLNRYVKENFVSAARSLKSPLSPVDIGVVGAGRIFVNDHLTVKNKALLSQAKALAKERNYQFVWVKHMKIFVRRDPTSKTCNITTERDLQKIR